MIHVAYAIHDANGRYSRIVGTSIGSLLANTHSPVTVHLLHDASLSAENIHRFQELVASHGQTLSLYNVEEDNRPGYATLMAKFIANDTTRRFTLATFYRLLLPFTVPADLTRILYLDGDTIVHMDIRALWDRDISKHILAAVPEILAARGACMPQYLCSAGLVKREDYFNAGVLSMNLTRFREFPALLADGLDFLQAHPACVSVDQDILNYYFAGDYHHLPQEFDLFVQNDRHDALDCVDHPGIRHYVCSEPLLFDQSNPNNALFFRYFARTPWCTADSMAGLLRQIEDSVESKIRLYRQLLQVWRERQLVILYDQAYREQIEREFGFLGQVQRLAIDTEADGVLQPTLRDKVAALMSARTIFLVFAERTVYRAIQDCLVHLGGEEGADFVNGLQFLSGTMAQTLPISYVANPSGT